jgi:predicted secreted protein
MTITELRKISKQNGYKKAILLFEKPNGEYGYTSYGYNKSQCDKTKIIADKMYSTFGKELKNEIFKQC